MGYNNIHSRSSGSCPTPGAPTGTLSYSPGFLSGVFQSVVIEPVPLLFRTGAEMIVYIIVDGQSKLSPP
jgi:hypothetical protein